MYNHLERPCPAGYGVNCTNGVPSCGGVCDDKEIFVRYYALGPSTVPMTAGERQWCIDEADRAGEGAYPPKDTQGLDDKALAKTVLMAWADYVSCNCL